MGLCVLVFESSGDVGYRPQETECDVPCSSGTGFVVGRSTPYGDVAGAISGAPMEIPSSLYHQYAVFWQIRQHPTQYGLFSQVQRVMVHACPRLAMCQRRLKGGAREGEDRL